MKIAGTINQIVVWLACVATSAVCLPVIAGATTYSAPAGEAVTGDYAVDVNGRPADVYAAQSEFLEGDYYFASFDFAGKAKIRVTSAAALDSVVTAFSGPTWRIFFESATNVRLPGCGASRRVIFRN
jgi:hypothetical protein